MHKLTDRYQLPFMLYYFSFMRKIDRRQLDLLMAYIIPDIQFRPVTDRKYSYIFSFMNSTVINIPKLGSLQFWIPLPKLISYGKDPFFGPGFFFITSCTTNATIK